MESSYKIIKGGHIDHSRDDRYVIDTDIENIEEEKDKEEIFIEKNDLELNIDNEEKAKIMEELNDYKKRMNTEIEFEKRKILENTLIDAAKEAMQIRTAAREEGYREGFTTAIDAAKAEAKEIKSDSLDILKQVKEYRDNYLRENEENIYDLAAAMAENIIHYSIDADDKNIINLIQPLLEEYLKEEDITISTTKRGKELLEKHKDGLEKICPNTRFIFLVDKSIAKNGFIIENKESIVDLGISLQLENMIKAISDLDG